MKKPCLRRFEVVKLFSRNKQLGVQQFVLKLLNNNCPEMKALYEGPRRENRINLTLAVLVAPLEKGKVQAENIFYTVTKDFSVNGVGIVMNEQRSLDEVILGLHITGEITLVRARAKHMSPMGGGFFQLGLELTEMACISDYPQLKQLLMY
jgi:hypothetical protein